MTVTTHRRASLLIVLVAAFLAVAGVEVANAAPAPSNVAHAKKCITDVSTHDKGVKGKPLHLFNAVHFKWCPGSNTITNQWAQTTMKSTNGKNIDCSRVAGVWTNFYFASKSGVTQGNKKVHVLCSPGHQVLSHRSPVTDDRRYKVHKHAWPKWTGYNQVAYHGVPQSFVWIRGHLNPFELGHRMATLIDIALSAVAVDRVAGQVASVV